MRLKTWLTRFCTEFNSLLSPNIHCPGFGDPDVPRFEKREEPRLNPGGTVSFRNVRLGYEP